MVIPRFMFVNGAYAHFIQIFLDGHGIMMNINMNHRKVRYRMTIGKAIDYLIGEYFDAIQEEHIRKPISYALYQTWKWADGEEKSRKMKMEVQDADCD